MPSSAENGIFDCIRYFFVVWELLERQSWNMPNNTFGILPIITKTATVCEKMTEDMRAARKHLASETVSKLFSERDRTGGDD
jgi:hypothetical protein